MSCPECGNVYQLEERIPLKCFNCTNFERCSKCFEEKWLGKKHNQCCYSISKEFLKKILGGTDDYLLGINKKTLETLRITKQIERPVTCPDHKDHQIFLYCSDCSQFVCDLCLIETHNGHKLSPLAD